MNSFKELNLADTLMRALDKMKYSTPTPIQAQAIPVALAQRDLIGCAQTGTGKTAAFGIPMIVSLLNAPKKTALVLAPTRELAAQIVTVIQQLTSSLPQFRTELLIGGLPMGAQIRALSRMPRIIVATPGRLVDHLQHRTMSLANVQVLVLDEADRMLDMGFQPQLREILRYVPADRQTMMFSATLPAEILSLAASYLKDPVRINAGGPTSRPVEKITQEVLRTTNRNEALVNELNARRGSVLVFARTKARTDRVAKMLDRLGHNVDRIHGDRTQSQRTKALDGFRAGKFRILVATDIAARGIDIPHIEHVINYDLPQCSEDYIHRIGRTARAGAEGFALAILMPEDEQQWREIKRQGQRAAAR